MSEQEGEIPLQEPIDSETEGLVADILTATSRSERTERIISLLDAQARAQNEYGFQLEDLGTPDPTLLRKMNYMQNKLLKIKESHPWAVKNAITLRMVRAARRREANQGQSGGTDSPSAAPPAGPEGSAVK